jgi:hypothetical protein
MILNKLSIVYKWIINFIKYIYSFIEENYLITVTKAGKYVINVMIINTLNIKYVLEFRLIIEL